MHTVQLWIIFIISLITTLIIVPVVKKIAIKRDIMDYPDGRRVNTAPIPRLGGVAMFAGMSIGLIVMMIGVNIGIWDTPFTEHPFLEVNWTVTGIGVAMIFAIGVIDDVHDINPKLKFIGQIISACVIASSGVLLESIGNPMSNSTIPLGQLAYPITVVYLVAFVNIMNLIDGLDGLCCGITMIACCAMMLFAGTHYRFDALVLGSTLMGACIAFMKSNWHPASIFMGDSGSMTLGMMLGIISLVSISRSAMFTSLLIPILAAGVPILDTLLAILRRVSQRKPIDVPDREHIHHKLLDLGIPQEKAVTIMLAWTAILATGGVCITMISTWEKYVVFAVLMVISWIIISRLGLFDPVLAHFYYPRNKRRTDEHDNNADNDTKSNNSEQ